MASDFNNVIDLTDEFKSVGKFRQDIKNLFFTLFYLYPKMKILQMNNGKI